jgi:hypothetical protein
MFSPSVFPLRDIETITFLNDGSSAAVFFDDEAKCNFLHFNNEKAKTGLFKPATTILQHPDYIFLAGDSRILQFKLPNLEFLEVFRLQFAITKKVDFTILQNTFFVSFQKKICL